MFIFILFIFCKKSVTVFSRTELAKYANMLGFTLCFSKSSLKMTNVWIKCRNYAYIRMYMFNLYSVKSTEAISKI